MKSFLNKLSTNKPNLSPNDDNEEDDDFEQHDTQQQRRHHLPRSQSSSPTKSPTKSSSKSPAKSPTKGTPHQQQNRSSTRDTGTASPGQREAKPRTPRQLHRSQTDNGSPSSSRRGGARPFDLDTHPLNLPPEQRKRLSALSAMSGRNSMDVDREPPNGVPSSPTTAQSPKPPQPTPAAQQQPGPQPPPAQAAAQSFTLPVSNGSHSPVKENAPVPPPHRSNPASPTPSPTDEAEAFKAAGNKFFKEKDYKKAIEQYSKAVELVPNSATYLSNRAAALMSAWRYEAALDDCKKAVDLDPNNPKTLLRLARIYTSLGRPGEALLTYGRIHQPPVSAKDKAPAAQMLHHVTAAKNALEHGSTGSMAIHALDQAEKLLGQGAAKPRAWQLMRGEAYLKMGGPNELGEAANIAMGLLRQNPANPDALVLRGRALYAQGDNAKAISHFQQALQYDPDLGQAKHWLKTVRRLDRMKEEGNADWKAGRWQPAVDKYTAALAVDPNNRGTNAKILVNRALCRIKLGDYDAAVEDCDRAYALDASYTKARRTKANALGQAGNWEDSVREWKSLAELEPEDRTIAKEVRRAELELKKSKRKDYYKILGVEKDADDAAIKKAYRRLAIVHHPDKNPNDEQAAERFKDIGEAYETLSDPQKRSRYDSGDDLIDADMFGGGGGPGGMHGGMGIDPEILFNMMGGGGPGGSRGGGGGFPPGFSFNMGGPGGAGPSGTRGGGQSSFPPGFSF